MTPLNSDSQNQTKNILNYGSHEFPNILRQFGGEVPELRTYKQTNKHLFKITKICSELQAFVPNYKHFVQNYEFFEIAKKNVET